MDTTRQTPTHATRTRRRAWALRWGVAGVAVVLAAGGAVGASAAAPAPSASATAAVGTIPPLPPGGSDLAAILRGAANDVRAKIAFTLPMQVQRVYAGVGAPIIKDGYLTTFNEAYVVTNPGTNPTFGVFPDTVTTVMGFGALPVKATIHLTQLSDAAGVLEPIKITNVALSNVPFSSDTTVVGRVLVRISDVFVDQVPLDVGPNCAGSTPVTLNLTGHDDGGHLLPTDYNPFDGGPLAGTFALPAFSGCGAGDQDLDPLLTGTVSGPGNAIVLNQSPLGEFNTGPRYPNDCKIQGTRKPCTIPTQPPLPTVGN